MNKPISCLLFSLLSFFCSLSYSYSSNSVPYPPHPPLSIPELIDVALQNNPDTMIAWMRVERHIGAQALAKSEYYPDLNLNADLINGRDYKFPNADEVSYTTAGVNLAFSYLLFDFGERRQNFNAATAALIAANWSKNATFQKVVFEVLSHTYKYLNAIEILESHIKSLQDSQLILKSVEELNRIGLRSITDVYAVRTTNSEMQMEVARQKAEVAVAYNKLIMTLGLNSEEGIAVATLPDPSGLTTIQRSIGQLQKIALEQRADLLAKRANIIEKQALLAKGKAQYLPNVRLGGSTGYNRYFDDQSNGFTYKVGLFFEYPLFDGFSESAVGRMNFADLQMANMDLEKTELDVIQEISSSNQWFETAQEVFLLSKIHLQNSSYTFSGTLEKYQAGTQSIFDLLAAQKVLAQARLQHGRAKSDWYRTLAQLAYVTGDVMSYREEAACINTP